MISLFVGCLSLDSYIKPQRAVSCLAQPCSCLSLDSYIKPQPSAYMRGTRLVVYLLIPTSNHNSEYRNPVKQQVVYLLIPTSNHNASTVVIDSNQLFIS